MKQPFAPSTNDSYLAARALVLPFALGVLAIPRFAMARDEERTDAPTEVEVEAPKEAESNWYGAGLLAADGIALGVLAGGSFLFANSFPEESDLIDGSTAKIGFTMAAAGALGYLTIAPISHAVHGDAPKVIGSVALRVGAPLAIGGLLALGDANGDARAAGLFGAMITAALFDDLLLARASSSQAKGTAFGVTPLFDPVRHAASLSAGGVF